MKYVFTFNEINYGRIEIEAACRPTDGEIIEKIIEGKADYNNTDFTDFRLVEMDGKPHNDITKGGEVGKTAAWNGYLQYLRDWADSHEEPRFYGMTPPCFDEWRDNEYQEEQTDDSYMCCLHETLRTFDWCENNCDRYYSCDTVAWAADESNEDKYDEGVGEGLRAFEVTITESLQQTITIMANNPCEAEETAQGEWNKQDHILDADNFTGVDFKAVVSGR